MVTEKTIRLTTAQALVKFLNQQYIEVDGEMAPFVMVFSRCLDMEMWLVSGKPWKKPQVI